MDLTHSPIDLTTTRLTDAGNEPWMLDEGSPAPAGETGQPKARTILQEAEWVFQNIGRDGSDGGREVTAREAPSPGAWWLLLQAREDSKVLLQPLMLLARKQQLDEEEIEIRRDCKRTQIQLLKLIERLESMPL